MASMAPILFENGIIWQWKNEIKGKEEGLRGENATWMVVQGQRITAVGTKEVSPELRTQCNQVIDLKGKFVLPGLQDSHIHIYYMGALSNYVGLHGCKSVAEIGERLQQHQKQYPSAEWIVGFGWEQDLLNDLGSYPTRYDLDAFISDKPVFLWRACWHIAVANTKALQTAGMVLEQTKWDIKGGKVDVQDGSITGVLRETAVDLVQKHIHEKSDDIRKEYLMNGLTNCLQNGLTAVHTNDHNAWKLYRELQDEGKLPIRVFLTPDIDELGSPDIVPAKWSEGLITCNRIKLFADGSLGAETAALRTPYRDSDNTGILLETFETMQRKIQSAHDHGYRVEVHAIGDAAAAQVLGAMEKCGLGPINRPILTHCQVLGDDLIQHMARLGVIADVQPSFTITDAAWAQKRLPEKVQPYSYCWKTLLENNVVCAGGSDAPIETCNPRQGMYDAIFRQKSIPEANEGKAAAVYLPSECLSFEQALGMYTVAGAYTAYAEDRLGHIRAGYLADFVILDQDITRNPKELLLSAKVDAVWVDGLERYSRELHQSPDEMSSSPIQPLGFSFPGKNGRLRVCRCCRTIREDMQ